MEKRDSEALLKIIKHHAEPGATVFTDGWSRYRDLNVNGFNHYSVIHKDSYTKSYKNETTGEIIKVDTNTVEGDWQMPKEHFKMRHGVELTTFEGPKLFGETITEGRQETFTKTSSCC